MSLYVDNVSHLLHSFPLIFSVQKKKIFLNQLSIASHSANAWIMSSSGISFPSIVLSTSSSASRHEASSSQHSCTISALGCEADRSVSPPFSAEVQLWLNSMFPSSSMRNCWSSSSCEQTRSDPSNAGRSFRNQCLEWNDVPPSACSSYTPPVVEGNLCEMGPIIFKCWIKSRCGLTVGLTHLTTCSFVSCTQDRGTSGTTPLLSDPWWSCKDLITQKKKKKEIKKFECWVRLKVAVIYSHDVVAFVEATHVRTPAVLPDVVDQQLLWRKVRPAPDVCNLTSTRADIDFEAKSRML